MTVDTVMAQHSFLVWNRNVAGYKKMPVGAVWGGRKKAFCISALKTRED